MYCFAEARIQSRSGFLDSVLQYVRSNFRPNVASFEFSLRSRLAFHPVGGSKDAGAALQTAAMAELRIGSDVDMDEEVLLFIDR